MAGQLDVSWSEQEGLLSDAEEEDWECMEELNELLTTVSRISAFHSFPWTSVSRRVLIQFPSFTIREKAALIRVAVDV
jgi:hypothetical protein